MNPRTIAPLSLLILGALSLVGTILLAALGHPIPEVLPTLDTVSLSALAGAAVPAFAPPGAAWTPPSSPPPSSPTPAAADATSTAGGGGIHIVGGVLDPAA